MTQRKIQRIAWLLHWGGGKELKSIDEVEQEHSEAETEKANHNSINSEKKKSITGLLDETQHLRKHGEVVEEEKVQKEQVRAYQPHILFPHRLK